MATVEDHIEGAGLKIDGAIRDIQERLDHPRRPPSEDERSRLQDHIATLRSVRAALTA
jgi:hypothetical protein